MGAHLALALAASLASGAVYAGERFAVVIGNNRGSEADAPLMFAEDDAQKVADALVRVGGFAPSDVVTLRGANDTEARRALISMNVRVRQSGERALLVVYYSGHADAEALHLGAARLLLAELDELVRGSAASFRVLVLDACRSGILTQLKGGRPAAAFALPSQRSSETQGYVVLTAAAAGEDAQESTMLRGSFFTHHFVSGLLGAADVDADLQVTLEEAYGYAFQQTVRSSSATLIGTQHPTFLYDVRGRGDVVLASLAGPRARLASLRFPKGAAFLVFASDGRVVGEVPAATLARSLVVAPGDYEVRARAPDAVYDGRITVGAGQERTLALADLERTAYARLVRKGLGGALTATWGPLVSYVEHTPFLAGDSNCRGVGVGWPVHLRFVDFVPRMHACASSFENDRLKSTQSEVVAEAKLAHVFDLPFVSLEVGALLGAIAISQSFAPSSIGGPGGGGGVAPQRTALGLTGGIEAGVVVDLAAGLFLAGGVDGRTAVLPLRKDGTNSTIGTPAVLGWRVGAGLEF